MLVLRILAIMLKVPIGALAVLVAWAAAVHPFDVAYRPPDWQAINLWFILGGVAIAFPLSIIPWRPLMYGWVLLSSIPFVASIVGRESAGASAPIGIVVFGAALLLSIVEVVAAQWSRQRPPRN